MAQRCKEYLDQLTDHRNKRALDFLGTGIKLIAGTPDHEDLMTVENKLNQLVKNNNKLAVVNSRLLQKLEKITPFIGKDNVIVLFEWLAMELTEIITIIIYNTINGLAKSGVFLIIFNGTVTVDGVNHTNERNNIREFLRLNRPAHYEVMDIIESENEEMKIPELNIISQIPVELEEHPI